LSWAAASIRTWKSWSRASAFVRCILLASWLIANAASAASWTASVDQREGLAALSKGGAAALSSAYAFWGANWAWAGQQVQFRVVAPFEYVVAGRNQLLDIDLAGRVSKSSSQTLTWELDLNAHSTKENVIGGGIVFNFDLATFGAELGEPELLPGNRGWTWGRAVGDRAEMRFDPPLAFVQFEGGQKSQLRAFFFKGRVPQGQRRQFAVLTVSGDMTIGPTTAERFGLDDPTAWPTGILDPTTSPVDLSFLNAPERPAGKRGFLQARNDRLVFADGTAARFWGTNLTAYTLFGTSREEVARHARRLSELGFNLVRLHHHDSRWVKPNIFGDQTSRDTRSLSSASLEKLDWWIKCLKDEGIYVWLDLHVGRELKAGDQIDGFEEISRGKPSADLKAYNYVNASIQRAMRDFNEAYVNHPNSYTGLRYKDDPAIAVMLITNENDVTHHFGNALLGNNGVPKHTALYMLQAQAFASKHGLPTDKVWRSWEHGPSKLFLNDLEQRFGAEMIAHLRALGVKVPIVTTSSWGYNPLSSLPALTAGNIIDAHSGGGVGELERNPIYASNLVHWIAAAQVAGKPLSVTEWGVEARGELAPDRHVIPLYVASTASAQGWDAVMHYAYSQEALGKGATPSIYHAYNDPSMIASLPAAALLYRQGHVREATSTFVFSPGNGMLFNQPISAANSVALRTAAERGKLMVAMPRSAQLPWLEQSVIPPEAKIFTDPRQSQINAAASEAVSDSGELRRDWDQGIFTIDTPRTQAAMGWVGGKKFALANVEIAVTTRNAAVAVQSLDGSPIGQSRSIMISIGARSVPRSAGTLPFYSEPVEGRLLIAAPQGLILSAWDAREGKTRQVPAPYLGGHYAVMLDKSMRSYWLMLGARSGTLREDVAKVARSSRQPR
jgi:hypothetical protein